MRAQRLPLYILMATLIVIAATSIWAVASSVTLRKQFRPDTYKESIVLPDKAEYCPGDKLSYTYEISAINVLGPTIIWDAWCRPSGLCDTRLTTLRYSVRSVPVQKAVDASTLVPELPPGEWRLVHATTFHGDGYDMFSVPFVVPETCGLVAPALTPKP